MNTREAVNYFFDNPKAVLKITKWSNGAYMAQDKEIYIRISDEKIMCNNEYPLSLFLLQKDLREYEVVRTLKKMDFGKAYYYMLHHFPAQHENLISCVSGKSYKCSFEITLEEYTGKWTVKGIYEE